MSEPILEAVGIFFTAENTVDTLNRKVLAVVEIVEQQQVDSMTEPVLLSCDAIEITDAAHPICFVGHKLVSTDGSVQTDIAAVVIEVEPTTTSPVPAVQHVHVLDQCTDALPPKSCSSVGAFVESTTTQMPWEDSGNDYRSMMDL